LDYQVGPVKRWRMAAVTHGSDGTGMQNMLHRTSPVMADFVAKVPKYQATFFSQTNKLN
jgi:hypothetical protein